MKKIFMPDGIFTDIYEISPDFFASQGIKVIVSDIDNTLVTYDDEVPTPSLTAWLDGLKRAGIKICYLSNNEVERVEIFNKATAFEAIGKARKPLTGNLKRICKALNCKKEETCLLGDQIFTDVLCGNLYGIKTFLVSPIKDKTDFFTRFKRKCEKPIVKAFKKQQFNK